MGSTWLFAFILFYFLANIWFLASCFWFFTFSGVIRYLSSSWLTSNMSQRKSEKNKEVFELPRARGIWGTRYRKRNYSFLHFLFLCLLSRTKSRRGTSLILTSPSFENLITINKEQTVIRKNLCRFDWTATVLLTLIWVPTPQ